MVHKNGFANARIKLQHVKLEKMFLHFRELINSLTLQQSRRWRYQD